MSTPTDERWRGARVSPETTNGGTFSRTLLRIRPLKPEPAHLVDALFALALGGLALWGFRDTFAGQGHLVVGVLGLVLGVTMAHVAHALRAPVIVLVALTLAAFFLVGSVAALRSAPVPGSFEELAHLSIFGWKDLLTTLPPVDGDGPLLVLPYLLGLLAGALAQTLAVRSRLSWAPVTAVLTLLGVVILLGVAEPASLLLQGGVFGVGALVWMSVRGQRAREVVSSGSGRLVRLGLSAGVLALAGLTAVPLGTQALASDRERLVLREQVETPFDVGRYPSPLAGFRRFRPANGPGNAATRLVDKELFRVEGAPAGTPVRIATLDSYDGQVWGAANSGGSPGEVDDSFQRVSESITNPLAELPGSDEEVTLTLGEGWTGVWLPTVGALTEVQFLDDETGDQAATFRYNLATSTAVVPAGTDPGDRFRMEGVVLDQGLDPGMGSAASVTVDAAFLGTQASAWSEGQADPIQRVLAVAQHLKTEGGYTDGLAPFQRYAAGHSFGRVFTFVNGDQIAGNDEQFAATMALMSNQLGVPARVVLGAKLPEDGIVKGKHVHAWVELRAADGTWRTLDTDKFISDEKPDENPPKPQPDYAGAVVPPPAPLPPPSTVGDPADGELDQDVRRRDAGDDDEGSGLPAWVGLVLRWAGPPLGVLALFAAAVLGLKARRRHRRRTAPAMTARIAGGWAHVVDRARDLRMTLPLDAQTRSEQASVIGVPTATVVAMTADNHVFGPGEPSETVAAEYWLHVDSLCREMGAGLSHWQRLRAALHPGSLRPTRAKGES